MAADELQFNVAGINYRSPRLNAFQQFHVTRRLGPVTGSMGGMLDQIRQVQAGTMPADPLAAITPFLNALAAMTDADVNYILNVALSGVTRQLGDDKGWAKLTAGDGVIMYADANNMLVMGQIVWQVLEGSLASFFSELLAAFSAVGTAVST